MAVEKLVGTRDRGASYMKWTLTGDGTSKAITHDVTGHSTALIKVDVPAGATATYAVSQGVSDDDTDGQELSSGTFTADAANYIPVSHFDGTLLIVECVSDEDLTVTIVSH